MFQIIQLKSQVYLIWKFIFVCGKSVVVDSFESMQCGSQMVNLKPLMMAQMIQSEHIWVWYNQFRKLSILIKLCFLVSLQMCPEQAAYTTGIFWYLTVLLQPEVLIMYVSANKCTETMNNYQYCDGKIYNIDAKGVFFFPHV